MNCLLLKTNSSDIKHVRLATGETNILLIEVVERDLRSFSDTDYIMGKMLMDDSVHAHSTMTVGRFSSLVFQALSNPSINQNIEFNMFDYKIFTPVKEMKASLNWNVFGRVNDDVMISPDGKFLLYRQTIDSTSKNGSFTPISDKELDNLVRLSRTHSMLIINPQYLMMSCFPSFRIRSPFSILTWADTMR